MVEDAIAARIIKLGGLTILVMLAAIVWHLLRVVLPLAESPQAEIQKSWHLPDNYRLLSMGDVSQNRPLWLQKRCQLVPGYLDNDAVIAKSSDAVAVGCDEHFLMLQDSAHQHLFRYNNSQLIIETLIASATSTRRKLHGQFRLEPAIQETPEVSWVAATSGERFATAAKVGERWYVYGLGHHARLMPDNNSLLDKGDGVLKGIVVNADNIVLLPNQEQVIAYQSDEMSLYDANGELISNHQFDSAIKSISTNHTGRSLFIETEKQPMQKWVVNNDKGHFIYMPSIVFDVPKTVIAKAFSPNEQAALFLTQDEELLFANVVTGEVVDTQSLNIQEIDERGTLGNMALYNDRLYVTSETQLHQFILSGQAAVTTSSLFQQLWYEGYPEADFIWQSTPSNSETEVKFSLIPLVIGSVKSAMLSMIVAIPLALGAAIYTAYFAPEAIRNSLKPVIEFLEAIPSVVIGFVAAGWMATMTFQTLLAMLISIVILPLVLWLIAIYQYRFTRKLPRKWQLGAEWLAIIVLLLLMYLTIDVVLSFWGGSSLASYVAYFEESHWNKSTLVVALALGIAIVPTIYSIAEDAIYDVPMSLRQASFALGATRLQTLKRVVLVAAAPAMLSAVMLGFSRAFGETILVLMITGNTPIADWDLMAGLRSMTANLAIELPEAEVNSVHYRVLFLTALILFAFTFFINTLAEWVRGNVRRRYRYV